MCSKYFRGWRNAGEVSAANCPVVNSRARHRAALVAGPDLMILDEPSEGLAPVIIERLEAVLKDVKAAGTPILLVEQNYHLATQLADYVYVLSQGRVQFAGDTRSLIAMRTSANVPQRLTSSMMQMRTTIRIQEK